jgi:ribose transport system ATP-binding protein
VAGSISIGADEFRPESPSEAIRRGVGFVPGDRNGEGAAVELSLRENLYLNPVGHALVPSKRTSEVRRARVTLERFDVRPPEPEAVFSTLSGGNAQKVMLARWLAERPEILVLNDPTAAVDIGARREIHRMLREAASSGSMVVVITSDMEEVEQVCDRALVCRGGQVVADLPADRISVSELTRYSYEAA